MLVQFLDVMISVERRDESFDAESFTSVPNSPTIMDWMMRRASYRPMLRSRGKPHHLSCFPEEQRFL